MVKLLRAAVEYARGHAATMLDGYPFEATKPLYGYSGYTGVVSTFRRAGFVEVARPKENWLIMRHYMGSE
ncbi:MAG: hypothetical protein HYS09_00555 [Chloroflexi bacterium]|nr:hypothetical protein [Chloroflexota bacterium]